MAVHTGSSCCQHDICIGAHDLAQIASLPIAPTFAIRPPCYLDAAPTRPDIYYSIYKAHSIVIKTLYIVRHCKAAGQQPDAPLTPEGVAQAERLADRLAGLPIQRIISSPFLRAVQSIDPLAQRLGLPIATDARLAERVLSSVDLPDWMAALQITFDDLDRCFEGGETSQAAMRRAAAVASECVLHAADVTLLVTHGNLMTLLLKHFDRRIGFVEWQRLTNPDVYRLTLSPERAEIARVWGTEQE